MYQKQGTLTDSVNVNLHIYSLRSYFRRCVAPALPAGFGSAASNVKGYALVQRETAHIDNIIEQCLV